MKWLITISAIILFSCGKRQSVPLEITDGPSPYMVDSVLYRFAIDFVEAHSFTSITAVQWKQVSGPKSVFFQCSQCFQTVVSGMTLPGDYGFELTVTDSLGLSGKDTCIVTVLSPVLPIQFKSLTGQPTHFYNSIQCTFEKTEEQTTLTLQNSYDRYSWFDVETVTTHENSLQFKDYSYQNITYYRAKETEQNGKVTYSQVIQVMNIPEMDELIIWSPVNNVMQFTFRSTKTQPARMQIYNSLGQIVEQVQINAMAGINRFQIPFARPAAGNYVAQLVIRGASITKPFTKQ